MQVPTFYRLKVGDLTATALSDGYIKGGEAILRNIEKETASDVLRACHRLPALVDVNAFVVEHVGRTMLIDTGSGRYMGRNAGFLGSNLEATGFQRSSIDTVFLTHIHPDHVGGLTSDGVAQFPNAELVINSTEHTFWMDDASKQRFNEKQHALFFDSAREQISPYRDRLRLVEEGEIFPGVMAQLSPGHTPGHSVCLISSGKMSLLIWADTVHVPDVQTAYPDAGVVFDIDPAGAASARRRVFEMAATDAMPVMGMHIGFPGLMRVERHEQSYRLIALPWHRAQ